MKVSMDGLRHNMMLTWNNVAICYDRVYNQGIKNDVEDLRHYLNVLRSYIGGLMCVYSEDKDDMFSDMADEVDKLLELTNG